MSLIKEAKCYVRLLRNHLASDEKIHNMRKYSRLVKKNPGLLHQGKINITQKLSSSTFYIGIHLILENITEHYCQESDKEILTKDIRTQISEFS